MQNFSQVDGKQLVTKIREQVGSERQVVAEFLLMLAEIDSRKLYVEEGYSALYQYVVALGFTEAEAFGRITVARLLQRFTWLYEFLADGSLGITALKHLGPYLTDDNIQKVVDDASGKGVRDVDKIVATLAAAQPRPRVAPGPLALVETPCESAPSSIADPKSDRTRYVTPEAVEVKFSTRESVMTKLDRVKALARVKGVKGSLDDILDHVLEDYLKRHDPLRRTKHPRKSAKPTQARVDRYVPRAVRYEVKTRDGYQCSFVSSAGHRCQTDVGLHIDHIQPFALGGSSKDPANLRHLCPAHNRLMAERSFGKDTIERCIQSSSLVSKLMALP